MASCSEVSNFFILMSNCRLFDVMSDYIRPNILLERHLISLAETVYVSRLLFFSCCCAKLTDVSECYLTLGDFCFVPFAVFFAEIFSPILSVIYYTWLLNSIISCHNVLLYSGNWRYFQELAKVTASEDETVETLASQKREARLRKFRELHFKRVSCLPLSD